MNEITFRAIVYSVSTYIIVIGYQIHDSILILCGLIIIVSHLYKDYYQLNEWPKWCELAGLILALTILWKGLSINRYEIMILGMMKLIAHCRQIIYNNNRYYY